MDKSISKAGIYAALISGAMILALSMGLRVSFGIYLRPISEDLTLDIASLSLAVAIQNLLWGLATPFFGALSDRVGVGKCLATGGILYCLGFFLVVMGDSLFTMHLGIGWLIGMGVGATSFPLVLGSIARIAPPEKRSLWLGIASAGGSFGVFIILPLAQYLMDIWDWQTSMEVLAFSALLILPLAYFLRTKKQSGRVPTPVPFRSLCRAAGADKNYILLTLGFFVCGFHVAFIGTHLPGYLESKNLSSDVGAVSLSLIGLFNIAGVITSGWLGGKYNLSRILTGIYLGRAIVIGGFLIIPPSATSAYIFAALIGLLWLSTVPATSGLVGKFFGPANIATLFGIVMFSHQIGAFFGAWLGGLAFTHFQSYDVVWILSIILAVMATLLHWPIQSKQNSVVEPEAA